MFDAVEGAVETGVVHVDDEEFPRADFALDDAGGETGERAGVAEYEFDGVVVLEFEEDFRPQTERGDLAEKGFPCSRSGLAQQPVAVEELFDGLIS